MKDSPLLRFDAVTKLFQRQEGFKKVAVRALDEVSFTIAPGEFVGLIGHNGAGKSTSIKLLMGFIRADEGTVVIRGADPNAPGARRSLGYVPENSSFSDFLTGNEILEAFGALGGLSQADRRQRSNQLLEALDIAHAADRLVRTYSKGMTQRLAIAQALIGRPDVLVLDEPMTGLDPVGRRVVLDVLTEELRRGVSLIFCSHLLADVEQLCRRILWLNRGKMFFDGATADLLQDRTHYELTYRGARGLEGARQISPEVFVLQVEPDRLSAAIGAVEAAGGRVESFAPATKALEEIFVESAHRA